MINYGPEMLIPNLGPSEPVRRFLEIHTPPFKACAIPARRFFLRHLPPQFVELNEMKAQTPPKPRELFLVPGNIHLAVQKTGQVGPSHFHPALRGTETESARLLSPT